MSEKKKYVGETAIAKIAEIVNQEINDLRECGCNCPDISGLASQESVDQIAADVADVREKVDQILNLLTSSEEGGGGNNTEDPDDPLAGLPTLDDWSYTLHESAEADDEENVGRTVTLDKWVGADSKVIVYPRYREGDKAYDSKLADGSEGGLFAGNTTVEEVEFQEGIDTSELTDMSGMFEGCENLKDVDMGNLDCSNVDNMDNMFKDCPNLENVNVSADNWPEDASSDGMFDNAGISAVTKSESVPTINSYWTYTLDEDAGTITLIRVTRAVDCPSSIVVRNQYTVGGKVYNTKLTGDSHQLFNVSGQQFSSVIAYVTFEEGIDYSEFTNMAYMFDGCTGLRSVTFPADFDTSHVTDMKWMFRECQKLTNLDLTMFDTNQVTTMEKMFYCCYKLEEVLVTRGLWVMEQANQADMFASAGCSSVTYVGSVEPTPVEPPLYQEWTYTLDSSSNTIILKKYNGTDTNVLVPSTYEIDDQIYSVGVGETSTSGIVGLFKGNDTIKTVTFEDGVKLLSGFYMFSECHNLSRISFGNIDTSGCTNMNHMFFNCSELADIDVFNFDTSNVTDMQYMFYGCVRLHELDLTLWNTGKVTAFNSMFNGCTNLIKVLANRRRWVYSTGSTKTLMFTGCGCSEVTYVLADGGITVTSPVAKTDFTNNNTTYTNSIDGIRLSPLWKYKGTATNIEVPWSYNNASANIFGVKVDGSVFKKSDAFTDNAAIKSITFEDDVCFATMKELFSGCTALTEVIFGNIAVNMFLKNQATGNNSSTINPDGVLTNCSCYYAFKDCKSLKKVVFSPNADLSGVTSMANMFEQCSALTTVDFGEKLHAPNVTNLSYMFNGCTSLNNPDLSAIDTSNVTDVGGMFYNCTGLTELDLTSWDVSNVKNFVAMFYGCSKLKKILVSRDKWQVRPDANITNMFSGCGCSKVTYIEDQPEDGDVDDIQYTIPTYTCFTYTINSADNTVTLSGYKGPNGDNKIASEPENLFIPATYEIDGTDYQVHLKSSGSSGLLSIHNVKSIKLADGIVIHMLKRLFYNCTAESIELGRADISDCTDMSYMFAMCSSLVNINLSQLSGMLNITDLSSMFNGCTALRAVDLPNFDASDVSTTTAGMFNGCTELERIDFSSCKINSNNCGNMFRGCSKLSTIIFGSGFNTSNCTNMSHMFYNCDALPELDLTAFDTNQVTDMSYMFYGCPSLASVKFGDDWDTSKVTDMQYMFTVCSKLTEIDLSGFNTSKVTKMAGMFSACYILSKLDLSKFNTALCTTMYGMFANCSSLITLDLTTFNTAKVTTMGVMFKGCEALQEILVNKSTWKQAATTTDMFKDCGVSSVTYAS